jgi:hypothetical protein
MFVPDHLKSNAYRILRLSVTANAADIHKAAAALRRAAVLGVTDNKADVLGDIPCTEVDLRTSVGRLENPIQRIGDRLFWFQLTPQVLDAQTTSRLIESSGRNPQALAALNHDNALHILFAALKSGMDNAGIELWVRAIRAWHQVMSDDNYWALSLSLEERGDFEPPALPSEIDALRDDTVRLAADPFIVSARDAVARNDASAVRRISNALYALTDTGSWAASAIEDIVSPAYERLKQLCLAIREESRGKIVHENQAAKRNKAVCDAALNRFRSEVEPALKKTIELLPANHGFAAQAKEAAALCLCGIGADYTWGNDFTVSEKLHEEALKLSHGTVSAISIEHALTEIREAAKKIRVLNGLTPIASTPSLYTINGFGFTVYGKSDYDAGTTSYATTHYFVALFVPVFPIARYRVIDAGHNAYRFLGKLPLRVFDRWHLAISIVSVAGVILSGIVSSNQSTPSSATSNFGPRVSAYSAPSNQSFELTSLKGQIESGRNRLEMLKTKLQPIFEELEVLDKRMESLKAELATLDQRQKAGLRIEISSYNAKVDSHNAILERQINLLTANRSDIEAFKDLATKDDVLVAQYNARMKR